MRRRDFVKGIVAAPIAAKAAIGQQASTPPAATPPPADAQPAPPAATAPAAPLARPRGGRGGADFVAPPVPATVPDVVAEPVVGFFTPSQFAALRKLSDMLAPPANGRPGALAAETPEFLDFFISSSYEDRQTLYRNGLDHLNSEAKKKFGVEFAALNATQADEVIRPGLKPWMQWHPPAEPFANFIAIAYDDIRNVTQNSEASNAAAQAAGERTRGGGLFWKPIDPDMKKWI